MSAIPSVCPHCYRRVEPKAVVWKHAQTPYCPHAGCGVAMVQTPPTRRADLDRVDSR